MPGLGYAYWMTAVALGCIAISGVFGSIFSPDFVSTSGTAVGYTREHTPVAGYSGWIWDVIAIAMVLPAALRGIRAKVTDRVAWTDEPATKLRQLAQLRDSGVITDADFKAKKDDLLSRI